MRKPADNPCPLELNVNRSHPIDIKIQSMDQTTFSQQYAFSWNLVQKGKVDITKGRLCPPVMK